MLSIFHISSCYLLPILYRTPSCWYAPCRGGTCKYICLFHNCISIYGITLVCLSNMFNSSASHFGWHNSCSFLLTVCIPTQTPHFHPPPPSIHSHTDIACFSLHFSSRRSAQFSIQFTLLTSWYVQHESTVLCAWVCLSVYSERDEESKREEIYWNTNTY